MLAATATSFYSMLGHKIINTFQLSSISIVPYEDEPRPEADPPEGAADVINLDSPGSIQHEVGTGNSLIGTNELEPFPTPDNAPEPPQLPEQDPPASAECMGNTQLSNTCTTHSPSTPKIFFEDMVTVTEKKTVHNLGVRINQRMKCNSIVECRNAYILTAQHEAWENVIAKADPTYLIWYNASTVIIWWNPTQPSSALTERPGMHASLFFINSCQGTKRGPNVQVRIKNQSVVVHFIRECNGSPELLLDYAHEGSTGSPSVPASPRASPRSLPLRKRQSVVPATPLQRPRSPVRKRQTVVPATPPPQRPQSPVTPALGEHADIAERMGQLERTVKALVEQQSQQLQLAAQHVEKKQKKKKKKKKRHKKKSSTSSSTSSSSSSTSCHHCKRHRHERQTPVAYQAPPMILPIMPWMGGGSGGFRMFP